ncbi:MAG: UbiD family decarboxylase [Candidatus Binataceae bacterium]
MAQPIERRWDLREFIQELEAQGELRRIKAEVDWNYEAGAMSRLVCERRGPAPLFENIKGYPGHNLAAVLLGPGKPLHARTAIALGIDKNTPPLELIEIIRERFRSPIAPVMMRPEQAPCKEVILKGADANLLKFPIPWIKAIDGNRYIGTSDIVITKDPESEWVNWATYRCMLKDEKHFVMLLMPRMQHGGGMFGKYEAQGAPMPIALVIGAEPSCHLAATSSLPHGVSEADMAGGLMGQGVPLVKCETSGLLVPATAEIIIEGEVIPNERSDEGPFGEFTGHATHRGKAPVIRVNCITHRRNPIFTMANMGKPYDDYATPAYLMRSACAKNWLEDHGISVKSIFYYVPEIAVVAVKPAPGRAKKIISTLAAGSRLVQNGIIFVEEDVDVTNVEDVFWSICSRMHPDRYETIRDVVSMPLLPWMEQHERDRWQAPMWVMDSTFPFWWSGEYRADHTKVADFTSAWPDETKTRVLRRWKEYGYEDV